MILVEGTFGPPHKIEATLVDQGSSWSDLDMSDLDIMVYLTDKKNSAEGEIRTHETLADHQLSRLAPYR